MNLREVGTVEEFRRNMVREERVAPDGRTWGLLSNAILGDLNDLWIAEKVNGRWVRPRFTGVGSFPAHDDPETGRSIPRLAGKDLDELVRGAWFDLRDRPELTLDTDRDGLTDLMERRLGTDPGNPDTDGDGDRDGTDPMPNAPKRELSEAEQIFAVALEFALRNRSGYWYGAYAGAPVLLQLPSGMAPFEVTGWPGLVVWRREASGDGREQRLVDCWGGGCQFTSCPPPRFSAEGDLAVVTVAISDSSTDCSRPARVIVRRFGDVWAAADDPR